MDMELLAPYGTWESPIGTDLITQKTITLIELLSDPILHESYHIESRPFEDGRYVLVHSKSNQDVFGKEWSARTQVHGYGEGAATVWGGVIYFSDGKTGGIMRIGEIGKQPVPVTPDNKPYHYSSFQVHPVHRHILIAILEDHTHPEPANIVNTLVAINTLTEEITTIAEGADFYFTPRISPDGTRLAWVQWYHPDMPWDGTELYIAAVSISGDSISISTPQLIAGHKSTEAISQPNWISNESLVFLTDKSDFNNPWRFDIGKPRPTPILPKPINEEFGEVMKRIADSSTAVLSPDKVVYAITRESRNVLYLLDTNTGSVDEIETPFTEIVAVHGVDAERICFIGTKYDDGPMVVEGVILPRIHGQELPHNVLKKTSNTISTLPPALISKSQAITFKASDGSPLHILYHPPANPKYKAPSNEKPPAVVNVHGGPVRRVAPGFLWMTQYFTSREFAWIDVNYGGSAGYGRAYRNRVAGQWGVVDVEDCVSAVKELASHDLIDSSRVGIRGESAGGYTVLQAEVNASETFGVGVSLYGVSDLILLFKQTHKYESHFLESFIGGTPETIPKVYHERSPVFHAEKISKPLLMLQGTEDVIVPINQSDMMVEKIRANGGKVEYIVFEGEGHGFRKADSIRRAIEAELRFYKEIFNLIPN